MAGVRPEGWLRCCADNAECRGHAQYPAFASDTQFLLWARQKWELGFWSFVCFWPESVLIIYMRNYFFSPV